jgi:hypothetical protein
VIHQQLAAALFALAFVSLGAAVVGLYIQPREVVRGFWFMCGIWGFIDAVIAWFGFVQEPLPIAELKNILGINLGLQAIYLPVGVLMLTRAKPILKGFGWGILVSAIALAIVDTVFYLRCVPT